MLVKDVNPGSGNGVITGNAVMVPVGDKLFFQANDGVNGIEMWASDGTTAGTQMLADLSAGSANTNFALSTGLSANDLFFFAASVPDGARFDHSLYASDGTAAGTYPVFTLNDLSASAPQISNLAYSGGRLYFQAPIDINLTTGAASNFELFAVNVVPEPSTLGLVGIAALGMIVAARRRGKCVS